MKRLSTRGRRWLNIGLWALAGVAAFAIWWLALRRDIMPERELVRVMADMYVVDALVQDHSLHGSRDRFLEEAYHSVLEHYGVTKADYDTALAWYSRRPSEYDRLYGKLIDLLSEREASAQQAADRVDSAQAVVKAANDSLLQTLAQWPALVRLPLADKADTLRRSLHPSAENFTSLQIDVPLDSLRGGKLRASLRYDVESFLEGCRPLARLTLTLRPDSSAEEQERVDSVRLECGRRITGRDIDLVFELPDTCPATHAKLAIEHPKLRKLTLALRNLKLTYRPYEIADTAEQTYGLHALLGY